MSTLIISPGSLKWSRYNFQKGSAGICMNLNMISQDVLYRTVQHTVHFVLSVQQHWWRFNEPKTTSLCEYSNEERPRHTSIPLLPRIQIKRPMQLSGDIAYKNLLNRSSLDGRYQSNKQNQNRLHSSATQPGKAHKKMINHSLLPATATHWKCADDLKSLEKECSLSLATCTCFSKVHGERQFLLINSAVGTRTYVENTLKFWQVQ